MGIPRLRAFPVDDDADSRLDQWPSTPLDGVDVDPAAVLPPKQRHGGPLGLGVGSAGAERFPG